MEESMPKNFLYTKSYTTKRLKENGFSVKSLPMRYSQKDKRYWSVLVNFGEHGDQNMILTCLKSGIADKKGSFIICGHKFFAFKIETKSADVLVDQLKQLCEDEEKPNG